MERLNSIKAKASEFAASKRGKGNQKDDTSGPRYFATIDTKDVSTFAPPPRRVGNIPGARPEDRDKGLATPSLPARRDNATSARASPSSNVRPPPPLPTRGQTSDVNGPASIQQGEHPVPPRKLTTSKPPIALKPTSPELPPRRESEIPDGQDSSSPPTSGSTYGQFRKTFGTAVDSAQVSNITNAFRKATSPTSATGTTSTTAAAPAPSRLNMSDLRTASNIAQKYNKDPKSISLSDAKAGLSLANKVLPPPTDKSPPNKQDLQTAAALTQKWNKDPKSLGWSDIKAGYAVANKFRPDPTPSQPEPASEPVQTQPTPAEKPGLSDLKSRFASVSLVAPPSFLKSTPIEQPQPPPKPQQKRPPPPPPPRPKASSGPSPPPPTFNLSTKPKLNHPTTTPQPSTTWTPTDIPLNLEKKWYCADPMQQIPYLTANPTKAISASSVTASGSGYANQITWNYTATFAIRWTGNLSRTFIRVTWSSDNPAASVRAKQKHFPPPTPLSQGDLDKAAELYGSSVVQFCQSQMGRQVGNGECWTLAHDALEFTQGTVKPKVMVSCGVTHGQCIYQWEGKERKFGDLETVRPGDIVQYLECKFERRQNGRLVFSSTAGSPDHTSVVTGKRGNVVEILHQNVGGVRKVQKGELIVDEMISGKLWIYRPVWESWAGGLEPKWESGW